jgi:hypothetical protein
MALFVIKAAYDNEAEVWCVQDSDVPGLATEAATFDEICDKIRTMVPELLEADAWTGGDGDDGDEVLLEIVAHRSFKVRLPRVA